MNCWQSDADLGAKPYKLPVFNTLGFTFLCPVEWESLRWTGDLEVNHLGLGHHVNTFNNMEVIDKWTHRAQSGREGQAAKRQKRQGVSVGFMDEFFEFVVPLIMLLLMSVTLLTALRRVYRLSEFEINLLREDSLA